MDFTLSERSGSVKQPARACARPGDARARGARSRARRARRRSGSRGVPAAPTPRRVPRGRTRAGARPRCRRRRPPSRPPSSARGCASTAGWPPRGGEQRDREDHADHADQHDDGEGGEGEEAEEERLDGRPMTSANSSSKAIAWSSLKSAATPTRTTTSTRARSTRRTSTARAGGCRRGSPSGPAHSPAQGDEQDAERHADGPHHRDQRVEPRSDAPVGEPDGEAGASPKTAAPSVGSKPSR